MTYASPFNKWRNGSWDRSSGCPVTFHSGSLWPEAQAYSSTRHATLLEQAHRHLRDFSLTHGSLWLRSFMVDSDISVASFILNKPKPLWLFTCRRRNGLFLEHQMENITAVGCDIFLYVTVFKNLCSFSPTRAGVGDSGGWTPHSIAHLLCDIELITWVLRLFSSWGKCCLFQICYTT